MGQIDSLAFLSSEKGNCKEVECPQFLQVKRGKSTSTTKYKILQSTHTFDKFYKRKINVHGTLLTHSSDPGHHKLSPASVVEPVKVIYNGWKSKLQKPGAVNG